MAEDSEMAYLNAMLRVELERFKDTGIETKRQVVGKIKEAGALDWLIEVCEKDDDPAMREYAALAKEA